MKTEREVKRITCDRTEAKPEETLYVSVPKLSENQVIMPDSLALRFNIELRGGHVNNFLVNNVARALVGKLAVKYAGTTLQDTVDYDICKIHEDPLTGTKINLTGSQRLRSKKTGLKAYKPPAGVRND